MSYSEKETNSIEKLKNALLHKIEAYLKEADEFIPFGMLLTSEDKIRMLSISDESEDYTVELAVEQLKRHIDDQVTHSEDIVCGGFCQDFLVNDDDAIHLNLISHNSHGWISCLLPYYIQSDRSLKYGTLIMEEQQS